jgi:hypothetical protein
MIVSESAARDKRVVGRIDSRSKTPPAPPMPKIYFNESANILAAKECLFSYVMTIYSHSDVLTLPSISL